jgi:hypothetical protein
MIVLIDLEYLQVVDTAIQRLPRLIPEARGVRRWLRVKLIGC